jgi:biopolymer transport protein ExbB
MSCLIDNFFPWLGDLLELGGPILGMILLIAFAMWWLLFERPLPAARVPRRARRRHGLWEGRHDHRSWFAEQYRNELVGRSAAPDAALFPDRHPDQDLPAARPARHGVGMLEVFDALAATGSNNPRSMAAGVSKATVSTLAGMVVAIVGLLAVDAERAPRHEPREQLPAHFPQMEASDHA